LYKISINIRKKIKSIGTCETKSGSPPKDIQTSAKFTRAANRIGISIGTYPAISDDSTIMAASLRGNYADTQPVLCPKHKGDRSTATGHLMRYQQKTWL